MGTGGVLSRLRVTFMLIFVAVLLLIDHGYDPIEIKVTAVLSAATLSYLLSEMLYSERKLLMRQFDDAPWGSGFACGFALLMLIQMLPDAGRYKNFMDYVFTILLAPIAMVVVGLTAYGRGKYLDKKQKAKRDAEAKKQQIKVDGA